MGSYNKYLLLFGILLAISSGCEKFPIKDKYQRPDWLPGKLFTTISVQDNLTLFSECLQRTGLDTIIDVSGSWSVFAPTNDAIKQYLVDNHYANISSIPFDELEKITKFHIIQNAWSLEQLQSLSIHGWRTNNDKNSDSYAYKRQTILKNPNEKFWIKRENNKEMVVIDSTKSDGYKKVFVQSRKYVPIFYDEYFNINGITSSDYSFYFDREYEQGNVYFAEAKILQANIFAENGFVHIIDRVASPMLNAKELLERELEGESYKLFLELIFWYYPIFKPNMTATYNQPEIRFGGIVDTLWDLKYAELTFALHNELTGYFGSNTNETLVKHNGIYVPIDNAFRKFIDGILTMKSGFPHWRNYSSLPKDIVEIIISQHLVSSPMYPSTNQYKKVFRSKGRYKQNEEDIIRKEFGSNCTFIGLNSYIPDRVFTSITGPVFLRPNYSTFRRALLYSQIDDDIAYINGEFCFFPIPDYAINADSSLILNWIDKDENKYSFEELNRNNKQVEPLESKAISDRILNHVGTSLPNGSANKEFIRTLKGNYIIWNNSDNTVRGNLPSTVGYKGDIVKTCYTTPLNEPADNGKTWSVRYWLNFESKSLRTALLKYSEFYRLLKKAGLSSFPNQNDDYTVFAPTNEAFTNYQTDTLTVGELRYLLKNHFVRGEMIFTDNKQPSGIYNTESGATLNIRTGSDIIEIIDKTGNPYARILENEDKTNIMVTRNSTVSLVVHEIDKVLTQ